MPPGAGVRGSRVTIVSRTTGRCVVLAYHAIRDLAHDPVLGPFSVPPALFAAQLDRLLGRRWSFLDADTFLAGLDEPGRLPPRSLLLTFDDGYTDLVDAALPILDARRIPFVTFVVSQRIGGTNTWDEAAGATTLPLLDGSQLRALAAGGGEIGSHTATHRRLPRLPTDVLTGELAASADALAELGLPRPRVLAYPYGAADDLVEAAAREAGYAAAFTTQWDSVRRTSNRLALPRVQIHAHDTPARLELKLTLVRLPGPVLRSALTLAGCVGRSRSAM